MADITPDSDWCGSLVLERHRRGSDAPLESLRSRYRRITQEDDVLPAHAFVPRPTPAEIARRDLALARLQNELAEPVD